MPKDFRPLFYDGAVRCHSIHCVSSSWVSSKRARTSGGKT